MPYGIRALFDTNRTEDAATIAAGLGAFVPVGAALDHPIRIMLVQNLTDILLEFSLDGVNIHFVLPSGGFLLLDISSDNSPEQAFFISRGSRLYAAGLPASGDAYFSAVYGLGDL